MKLSNFIFVLGAQRSGTTWIANIFDSHPKLLHFYEPFAPGYRLFPYFPDEFERTERPSSELAKRIRRDVEALVDRRSSLFDKVSISEGAFRFETKLMALINRVGAALRLPAIDVARQYELLHLNRLGQDPALFFKKDPDASIAVIKEVRLYLKAPLLAGAFPEARFVHVLRHPGAVVGSMIRYMERGRLAELRGGMEVMTDRLQSQPGMEKYAELLADCSGAPMERRLAALWRISNETLQDDLSRLENDSVTLIYEELATKPVQTVERLFGACGITMAEETRKYVDRSSTARNARRDILTTDRESRTYYKSWLNTVSPNVRRAVDEICGPSRLMSAFSPYYR